MMVDMKEVIEKEKDTFSKRFKSRVYMCIYIYMYVCMYVCIYIYMYVDFYAVYAYLKYLKTSVEDLSRLTAGRLCPAPPAGRPLRLEITVRSTRKPRGNST